LKLPTLLAEFLYQHHRLDLPGIGIFNIEPSADNFAEPAQKDRSTIPSIQFENAEITNPDEELIEHIKRNTGKIRPLAIADLDSYLALCKQMVNIGRPFFIEGIGTISKNRDGKFDFVCGKDDLSGSSAGEITASELAAKKQSMFDRDHEFYKMQRNTGKKIAFAVALIAGLAVVGGGGYMLYKKNSNSEPHENTLPSPLDTTALQPDTVHETKVPVDSGVTTKSDLGPEKPKSDSLAFNFVILQTENKSKALKRYNQLLSYLLKIKLKTRDSSFFKLYFAFPAVPKDTLRIKDSLNLVYATHTIIEPAMNN